MKNHPKISIKTHQFWKTLKFFKNPKTWVSKHEMHECERIGSLPREEILKKAWRILEEQSLEWDESVLGEKTEKYRERDWLKWEPDRTGSLNKTCSKSWQMQVSRRIQLSVEEVSSKCLSTAEVLRKYRGTTHQNQEQKLDRSTRCREAIEDADLISIHPPSIEVLVRLR